MGGAASTDLPGPPPPSPGTPPFRASPHLNVITRTSLFPLPGPAPLLGASWGPLGSLLGASWGFLGALLSLPRPSWGYFWASWGASGGFFRGPRSETTTTTTAITRTWPNLREIVASGARIWRTLWGVVASGPRMWRNLRMVGLGSQTRVSPSGPDCSMVSQAKWCFWGLEVTRAILGSPGTPGCGFYDNIHTLGKTIDGT